MERGPTLKIVLWLAGFVVLAAATTLAQEGIASDGYRGVRADGTGSPPRARSVKRASKRLVTWAGFQMRPDGGSRFFVQVSSKPRWKLERSQGRIEVIVLAARIHMRNNRRPLETRFFATPVRRGRLRTRGRDVALVLEMRGNVEPRISEAVGADGYHFIYVDFPAGDWGRPEPGPTPR